MSVDQSAQVAAVTERLRAEKSVASLLGTSARSFAELLGAPACTISRVIGDLLVDLFQHKEPGKGRNRDRDGVAFRFVPENTPPVIGGSRSSSPSEGSARYGGVTHGCRINASRSHKRLWWNGWDVVELDAIPAQLLLDQ